VALAPIVKSSWNAWVEVDTTAIRRNTEAVCAFVGAGVQVMAIVKADGYGHGAVPVARAALAGGASCLGVANVVEGIELRAAGIAAPVLILGCGMPEQAAEVVEHDLAQTLATEEMARALSDAAAAAGREVAVHIKVDTGMGRLGVRPRDALAFARLVSTLHGLRVDGIYSHLATADHDDATYACGQARQFQEVLAELAVGRAWHAMPLHEAAPKTPLRHLANSAAVVRFPQMRLDLVRTGLLIYGLNPLPRALSDPSTGSGSGRPVPSLCSGQALSAIEGAESRPEIRLTPALSWKTRIACIKSMPAGQRLSYGGLYTTKRPTRIACLPLGYADGYPRALSNIGSVLVGGRRCPVVGAVCMDQMLVELGEVEAKAGDEVVLIGEQMGERITANELAAAHGTVVHEIVARLGKRLPRVYLSDDASAESDHDRNG